MRSQRHKLERIDIDELFSSPVNRGMLSFLERPPEEAQARLREKQKVNAIDAVRLGPESELPPGSELQDAAALPSVRGDQGQKFDLQQTENQSSRDSTSDIAGFQGNSIPRGNLPSEAKLPLDCFVPAAGRVLVEPPDLASTEVSPNADLNSLLPIYHGMPSGVEPSYPGGELPPPENPDRRSDSLSRSAPIPVGEFPPHVGSETGIFSAEVASYPASDLTTGQLKPQTIEEHADQRVDYPVGNSPGVKPEENHAPSARSQTSWNSKRKYPGGASPRGAQHKLYLNRRVSTHIPVSDRVLDSPAQPEAIDGSVVGRRQKIRRAIVAQDGHSGGEQLLYQALWNAASVETPETRLLSIGYSGMSALCKLEKSNCKKNVQGLIQKLAVEITEPHQSVSSTGTTYRIFSYKEILRRREAAGMIWVVRTSGVRFVDPGGNLRSGSASELPGGAGGESLPPPVGRPTLGGEGSLHRGPIGKTHTQIEKLRKREESFLPSASENIRQLCMFARSQITEFDDDACRLLWRKCKEIAPDCTIGEVIYCFDLKARQLFNERVRNVANPVGLMIWSVPKMFEGPEALYLQQRRTKAEEAAKAAEAVAQFERNRANWQALVDNPSTSDEDRRFYGKLLGYTDG